MTGETEASAHLAGTARPPALVVNSSEWQVVVSGEW